MASLILEHGDRRPGLGREIGGGGALPPLAFNRLVDGDRFKSVFPSHDPAYFWRARVVASLDAKVSDNSPVTTVKRGKPRSISNLLWAARKPDYTMTGPSIISNLSLRRSAVPTPTTGSRTFSCADCCGAGIMNWAIATPDFGVCMGVTITSRPKPSCVEHRGFGGNDGAVVAAPRPGVQGTTSAGVGFGAAGTQPVAGERDYHFGAKRKRKKERATARCVDE